MRLKSYEHDYDEDIVDELSELINEIRDIMCKTNSVFKNTGNLIRNDLIKNPLKQKNFTKDIFNNEPLNYYLANSICRNSITMRKCSQL